MIIDDMHPWTSKHRIPVLDSDFDFINLTFEGLDNKYAVVLITDDAIESLILNTTVSEDEAFILGSYIEYLIFFNFDPDIRKAMKIMNSVDAHPDLDTIGFCKNHKGQWFYRRASWDAGVFYPPAKFSVSLLEILDDIEVSEETGQIKVEWSEWKRRYNLFES